MTESNTAPLDDDGLSPHPEDEAEIPYQSFTASTWGETRDEEEMERGLSPENAQSKNLPRTGEHFVWELVRINKSGPQRFHY